MRCHSQQNLNPGLQYFPDMPMTNGELDTNTLLSLFDQGDVNAGEAVAQAQYLDDNLLQGLPQNFDFNAWAVYFDRFNLQNNVQSGGNSGMGMSMGGGNPGQGMNMNPGMSRNQMGMNGLLGDELSAVNQGGMMGVGGSSDMNNRGVMVGGGGNAGGNRNMGNGLGGMLQGRNQY